MPDFLTDLADLGVGAEGLLAAVLEAAAQPIWVVDGGGVIRLANEAVVAALGYDRAGELVGRRSETLHDQTPHPAAAVARDRDWLVRRDGSKLPVSSVSVPIAMAEGRGAVVAFTDVEDRLRAEQALEAREGSLRRIAALVAGGATSADVFAAIAREVGHVVGLPQVVVLRFDPEQTSATVIGGWGELPQPFEAGTRWPLDGPTLLARVLKTGRPARIDDYTELPGAIAAASRESGFRAAAAAPIIVDGAVWGAMTATSGGDAPLPDHLEDRLAEFTELVATAIANTARRDQLARLADEQAALRRVATLVARGTSPDELFAAVAREVGRVLGVGWTHMARYEPDGASIGVAGWSPAGDQVPVGIRVEPNGESVRGLVLRTGRPARLHSYEHASGHAAELAHERGLRSSVGAPIVVAGRLWGVMMAASKDDRPLPADAESRLENFTELAATAIANSDAREEVARLVDEQAALRRVATLVAEGAPPAEVFETVTREVGVLCDADLARMERYESGDSVIGVAGWSRDEGPELAVGTRFALQGASIAAMVHEASRPVRVDSFAGAVGPIAREAQSLGIRSSVGCPIVVEGRLWGVIAASSTTATPFAPDTESQIAGFTELVATAIANTEARTELAASRARIVAATDDERRRVVRDLHDGAQQRMVHTVITLKLAQHALDDGEPDLSGLLTEALAHAEQATDELRELAHGILPAVLTQGGLRAGVDALASRMPVPVDNAVSVDRLPPSVEATAYFIIAEALTNVAKHAHAGRASVAARIEDGTVEVQVRDDGIGGARLGGSGLLGLADRLAVLDGQLRIESPVDGGTLVAAVIPVPH